jgi:hypothetical protein
MPDRTYMYLNTNKSRKNSSLLTIEAGQASPNNESMSNKVMLRFLLLLGGLLSLFAQMAARQSS